MVMPEGQNADRLRKIVLENFDLSLGTGPRKAAGKVFRIGHLGDTNDLTIVTARAGLSSAGSISAPGRGGSMAYLTERCAAQDGASGQGAGGRSSIHLRGRKAASRTRK